MFAVMEMETALMKLVEMFEALTVVNLCTTKARATLHLFAKKSNIAAQAPEAV